MILDTRTANGLASTFVNWFNRLDLSGGKLYLALGMPISLGIGYLIVRSADGDVSTNLSVQTPGGFSGNLSIAPCKALAAS